jgi:hypothetical protein
MSCFLFLWLLLVLGDLLENASCLVSCLTLLKEGNNLERVSRFWAAQRRFFTLLLRRGYFHHSMEVATLKVAKKLHLTPHELMHWHESGSLGRTKPANQLVAYIGKTGNSLEVVLDAFIEVCLCTICLIWTLLCNDAGLLDQVYILKALTHEVKQ